MNMDSKVGKNDWKGRRFSRLVRSNFYEVAWPNWREKLHSAQSGAFLYLQPFFRPRS